MVRAADIHDEESLKVWLETQPREVSTAIAARAALWVMPVWASFCLTDTARKRDVTPLPILWADLISAVAAVSPTAEIKQAAAYANAPAADARAAAYANAPAADARAAAYAVANAAAATANAAAATARAAAAAAAAATYAADARAATTTTTATAAATATATAAATAAAAATATAAAAAAATAVFWEYIRGDGVAIERGENLATGPLWREPIDYSSWFENTPPDWFAEAWDATRADWSRPASPYDFFRRWYETLLDPAAHDPFPNAMLYQIALIDDEVWKEGAEAVAKEIARIEEQFRLLEETRALKAELAALRATVASEAQRGHNHPPELVEPLKEVERQTTIIWASLEEAESQLQAADPSPDRLRAIAATLWKATKAVAGWLGKKADKGVDTAVTEGVKLAMKVGATTLTAHLLDRLFHLSDALGAFANMLH